MRFEQLIDPDLGCASYIVGDAGAAIVVDPGLDCERHLAAARRLGLEIRHVVETHVHADHVSGRALLAAATGARLHAPAAAGIAGADPLADGDELAVGDVRLRALATPGHRPEHTAYAVADVSRSAAPWLLLSGDSLLVGDVARPDLAIDARDGARALHASLRRLLALGDHVELWPGHVGGSLCGGSQLSRKTSSTLGYERRTNPLLAIESVADFSAAALAQLPLRPPTVERVVARNRGASPSGAAAAAPLLTPADAAPLLAQGAVLLDARTAVAFDAAHVPGSLSLPLTGEGLGTRAAWALDGDAPLLVLAELEADARELARRLRAVGLDRIAGVLAGGSAAWRAAGLALESAGTLSLAALRARLGELTLVDVRARDEWDAGHVAGAVFLPAERLRDGAAELVRRAPLVVGCAAGNRAAFAASFLRRAGAERVLRLGGGIPELPAHGVELVRG